MKTTIAGTEYTLIPIAEVVRPFDGFANVLVGRWWVVVEESILVFRRNSPQCNRDRRITEKLAPAGTEVRQIPIVYLPHNCGDYV